MPWKPLPPGQIKQDLDLTGGRTEFLTAKCGKRSAYMYV